MVVAVGGAKGPEGGAEGIGAGGDVGGEGGGHPEGAVVELDGGIVNGEDALAVERFVAGAGLGSVEDDVTGRGEVEVGDLEGGGVEEDLAFGGFLQQAVCRVGRVGFSGEADDVGLAGADAVQLVAHAGLLVEGDDGEAALEDAAEDAGAVELVGGRRLAVDGLDGAGFFERGGVVGLGYALEAEDGVGDGVLAEVAGEDAGDDVLVAEEAGDLGVVVVEVGFEALEDLVEGGLARRLGKDGGGDEQWGGEQ